ncbi:enoyl-CoA hydratase/isomerase family protein [Rhodococcus fascians]|uniref:3-hydroxyacyl-CoA dehydrogenase NAD-binding domain-containing protein n=1 Tax=Rhodococcoides fascians TaxID=1828 RepID=UPI001958A71D|nr:3-hydroxyacyl-CoA dehydrogenase NAD-binding domain-containing protein [Rhodococcus fascians]MBM7242820.1 enoyl-CoA hydratase/isomerase family protein [Rhodococcus fascians]MBY3809084.1 enoyl-CoA hydratase/isomerase family protein [Rhodococcus fascians]MBY3840968.1 enoyl-CoA hydratase/isomerase family protein [Rhodococcus fascians]MBY3846255.1 enoyl-CoA hydratase/isomerase family protein [Rhodococcus fascians]MBY3851174.1 enoyl-CoA hydratase/isomerase family protein [Rhodococcus fascians]
MNSPAALHTSTITGEIGTDRIVVLMIDDPAHSTNTMNAAFGESLEQTVEWLETELDAYDGIVVTSGKDSFFSGGDLELLRDAGPSDHAAIADALDFTKDKFRRLETLGKPVVAALGGTALGGGFEIALACHHRIALNNSKARFGLPEVTLGLLPGAGGVTRTVRMFGIVKALTQVVGQGQRYRPAQALELGLIDEVVDTHEQMMAQARSWITANPGALQPWDRAGFTIPGGTASAPAVAAQLPALTATVRKQVKGAPMPAPIAVVAAAVEGSVLDFDAASLVETRYCTSLACGPISGNLIQSMFFDLGSITKGASRPPAEPHRVPEKVLVIGAGMMGAAIAYVVASAGVPVILRDVSIESAERGKSYARSVLGKAVAKGRASQADADAVLALITPSSDAADAEGCDLVVEAVFEDPAVKQGAFEDVDKYLTADALLCSNTSTLPITALSQSVSRTGDFIGTHFFSPVDKMPLVEIVVGEHTSDSALARAFDFVRLIGKTPIVVGDSHGFFTTRVIGRFMDEAISLVAEGVHPATVEQAALQAGYPSGALALMDEISLTLSRHIREGMAEAARADGRPWIVSNSYALVDRLVDEFDRPGRKAGRGFYEYAEDGSKVRLWPGLVEHYHRPDHGIPFEDMMDRMLVAQSLDSVACLDEGVLRTVADANIGSILGIGFPAWTGGVLQFVNQFDGGLPGFVRRADELRARYGDRFVVPRSLRARTERYL